MKVQKKLFVVYLTLMGIFLIASAVLAESQATLKQLDINQATIEQLCELDGIDNVKATAIVEYRDAHGPFASIEDIKHIKGIGDTIFESIKEHITVTKVE
jgi:competence protein ComEA